VLVVNLLAAPDSANVFLKIKKRLENKKRKKRDQNKKTQKKLLFYIYASFNCS